MTPKTLAIVFTTLLSIQEVGRAQTLNVSNAESEQRVVTGDPVRYLRNLTSTESGPLWFGYAVTSNAPDNNSCCWSDNCTGCRLEGSNAQSITVGKLHPVQLEGSRFLMVLFRVQDHAVSRIHPVSENCPVDAGGLRMIWLTGVPSSASLAFLSEQVAKDGHKDQSDSALVTIAMHAGPDADIALERFAGNTEPEWLREKALFWLASSRGARGFAALKRVAREDTSSNIREKAMFDLSISKEAGAIDELIRFAKEDPNSGVRGQAIFWLSQKAGERASRTIQNSIQNDPDTEVKKKAVFALQQLPKDQGIPLLIQVARTNRNPEVRKQAIFWLGQSGDPRALEFLEQVLNGKT